MQMSWLLSPGIRVAVYVTKRIVDIVSACNIVDDHERFYGYEVLKFSLALGTAKSSRFQTLLRIQCDSEAAIEKANAKVLSYCV
jgi:phenylalanyl-tRNA synthetase beta subunit